MCKGNQRCTDLRIGTGIRIGGKKFWKAKEKINLTKSGFEARSMYFLNVEVAHRINACLLFEQAFSADRAQWNVRVQPPRKN